MRQRFWTELVDGWKEFTRQTWIWASVLYFGLFHLTALACFFVLAPVIAKRELGGSSAYATIMVGAGVGAVVGSLVAMRYRPRRQLLVVFLSTAAWSVVLVGYAVTALIRDYHDGAAAAHRGHARPAVPLPAVGDWYAGASAVAVASRVVERPPTGTDR